MKKPRDPSSAVDASDAETIPSSTDTPENDDCPTAERSDLGTCAPTAVYIRLGVEADRRRGVLQRLECRKAASRHGCGPDKPKLFLDAGHGGLAAVDRPALSALLDAVRRREFGVVLVESVDRLSRDAGAVTHIVAAFGKTGTALITADRGLVGTADVVLRGSLAERDRSRRGRR